MQPRAGIFVIFVMLSQISCTQRNKDKSGDASTVRNTKQETSISDIHLKPIYQYANDLALSIEKTSNIFCKSNLKIGLSLQTEAECLSYVYSYKKTVDSMRKLSNMPRIFESILGLSSSSKLLKLKELSNSGLQKGSVVGESKKAERDVVRICTYKEVIFDQALIGSVHMENVEKVIPIDDVDKKNLAGALKETCGIIYKMDEFCEHFLSQVHE
jgi:hypothetical protein